MYSFLFDKFQILLPECLFFSNHTKFSSPLLTKLEETIRETESLAQDSHYDDIRYTKGKESCVDTEIFRMLTLLDQQCERLNPLLRRAINIGICVQCHITLDEDYIVSQTGEPFCSE
jgi:hypothetical protein